MLNNRLVLCSLLLGGLLLGVPRRLLAASGTEAASFLDIPVGAQPAAVGSAYTGQAADAYATVYNPAGLAFLDSTQMAGTHQSYLETVHYEYLGVAHPLGSGSDSRSGLGLSAQYLGTGDIDARDAGGTPAGTFSASMAAYSLGYGRRWAEAWSWGATLKGITEKISDASGTAGAADLGLLYHPAQGLRLGAAATNLGPNLKLVSESDPLPMAFHLGGTYGVLSDLDLSAEGVYRRTGLLSGAFGVECKYGQILSVRAGYNTSRTKVLGAGAGITAGAGIYLFGQEFAYAWMPMGDLGTSHYFSLVLRFTREAKPDRPNLQEVRAGEPPAHAEQVGQDDAGYRNLYEMLSADEVKSIKKPASAKKAEPEK